MIKPTVENTAIDRSETRNSTMSCRAGGVASRIFRGRITLRSSTHNTSQIPMANTA
jgi:hypothetical protein